MFPNVEVRHLHAVIALGEELNFTKAALRLHLTQSFLRRYAPQRIPPKPIGLSLSARVVSMKKAIGPPRR